MSTGPRLPLATADALAAQLMARWGMAAPACGVVGSVRRRKPDVGDLELIAPLPPDGAKIDQLYEVIADAVGARAGLFIPEVPPIGKAVEGVKPFFKAASLLIQIRLGENQEEMFGVQVFRYTPENCGWQWLMRTGPDDFGKWFLWQWKTVFGIPLGEDRPASDKGHLVDANGIVVPVPSEEDCFRIIRRPPVPPESRAAFVDNERRSYGSRQREALR